MSEITSLSILVGLLLGGLLGWPLGIYFYGVFEFRRNGKPNWKWPFN